MAAPSSRQVLRNLLSHASLGAYLLFDPWHDQLNAMVRKAHTCFRYYIMKYLFTNINWKNTSLNLASGQNDQLQCYPPFCYSLDRMFDKGNIQLYSYYDCNSKCFIKCVIKMWIFSVWHSGALHFLNVCIKPPTPVFVVFFLPQINVI